MQVRLRYFAALREAVGITEEQLEVPAATTLVALRALLAERHHSVATLLPGCRVAVNAAYVAADVPLAEGDEVVFVPPVGGG